MRRNILIASVVALCLTATIALAADTNVGTWKLNVAKSKFSPGPAPKSQTLKIEASGADGVKFVSDGVGGDGKPTHYEFSAKYDGKDNPVKGNPEFDVLAYTRKDANTVEATTKLKGKVMAVTQIVVSSDGKTRTLTQKGKDAQGKDVNNTLVYDKQ
jgi:hypothetical protein